MKVSFILLLVSIIIGIVISDSVKFTISNIDWNLSPPPLYSTNVTDLVFIVDASNNNAPLKKSIDGGVTWLPKVTDINNKQIFATQGYYSQPYLPNILVVSRPSYGVTVCAVSRDGGATFKTSENIPYPIYSIKPHLTIDGLLIATTDQFILTSNDFGLTWNNASSSGSTLFKIPGSSRTYLAPLWDISELQPVFFAILNSAGTGVFSVSKDMGKTFSTIISGAVDMVYTQNYYYVGVLDTSNGGNKLYVKSLLAKAVSTMDGFLLCEFPFGEDVQPNDFRIIDDSAGAIFMGISTSKDGQMSQRRYGSVYVSNSAGNVFTLSVRHVSILGGVYDFIPLGGAKGSYLFNGVTNPNADKTSPVNIRSFISYDNGGQWSSMTPPADMNCNLKPCRLNVHGLSAFIDEARGYGPFYSIENAPGLVLATGNANPALASNAPADRIKTVFSYDNGQTWKKIFDQGSIYEFGSFGSCILLASAMNDTDTIYYTFDQGATLQSFTLPAKYDIVNIITNPDNNNNKFIMLAEDSKNVGKIIGVDLTPVQPAVCTAAQLHPYTTGCILGQTTEYQTVKPGQLCYLDAVSAITKVVPCACTIDDFECDIGYENAADNNDDPAGDSSSSVDSQGNPVTKPPTPPSTTLNCVVSSDTEYVPVTADNCIPGQVYTKTIGFRMIAGSRCKDGVNSTYAPTMVMCPSSKPSGSAKGWVIAVVLILVFGGAGGFGFYVYKNPDFKQKLKKMVGLSKSDPKYSAIGIKPNSLADDEFGIEDDDAQILNDNDLQDDDF